MKNQKILTLTTITLLGWSILGFAASFPCPISVTCNSGKSHSNCSFINNEGNWKIKSGGKGSGVYKFAQAQINITTGICFYTPEKITKKRNIVILTSTQALYPTPELSWSKNSLNIHNCIDTSIDKCVFSTTEEINGKAESYNHFFHNIFGIKSS